MSKAKEFKDAVAEMRGTKPFRGKMKERRDSVIMMPSMRRHKRHGIVKSTSHMWVQFIPTEVVFVGSPYAVKKRLYPIVKAVRRVFHDRSLIR